jgi:hypothetical protein
MYEHSKGSLADCLNSLSDIDYTNHQAWNVDDDGNNKEESSDDEYLYTIGDSDYSVSTIDALCSKLTADNISNLNLLTQNITTIIISLDENNNKLYKVGYRDGRYTYNTNSLASIFINEYNRIFKHNNYINMLDENIFIVLHYIDENITTKHDYTIYVEGFLDPSNYWIAEVTKRFDTYDISKGTLIDVLKSLININYDDYKTNDQIYSEPNPLSKFEYIKNKIERTCNESKLFPHYKLTIYTESSNFYNIDQINYHFLNETATTHSITNIIIRNQDNDTIIELPFSPNHSGRTIKIIDYTHIDIIINTIIEYSKLFEYSL